ncbi:MAG: hypothetical protein WC960_03490 [Bacteroidales bacterium]
MASIRSLKKDIDYLASEVLVDCQIYLFTNGGKNLESIEAIVDATYQLREDLFDRINTPVKEGIKSHFRSIKEDLNSGIDSLFEQISQLAAAKE